MDIKERYDLWKKNVKDQTLLAELDRMNDKDIEDAFFRDLAFGTGGLRGILGAGTNRMNIYVVAKATQGLSNYINKHFGHPSVAIGYDTRINSELFSRVAAEVFSNNGIKVNLYKEPLPVPTLSYATRQLKCSAGVMITASHNPSKYNGYKVYGSDGCQITTEAAKQILEEINKINEFEVIRKPFDNNELIQFIDDDVLTGFIEEVKKACALHKDLPGKMTEYLLGEYDFYKVISLDREKNTRINVFNLHGTLNQSSKKEKPKRVVPKTLLPTRIVSLDFKPRSKTTVELYMDNGWQFSFRIHSADKIVEKSLKFDIQSIGMPTTIISINCKWK